MIVIGKHRPRCQVPTVLDRQFQQLGFQIIQPLLSTKEVVLVQRPRRHDVGSKFNRLMHRHMRPSLGLRFYGVRDVSPALDCFSTGCRHREQIQSGAETPHSKGGRRHRKLWTDPVANGIVRFS